MRTGIAGVSMIRVALVLTALGRAIDNTTVYEVVKALVR